MFRKSLLLLVTTFVVCNFTHSQNIRSYYDDPGLHSREHYVDFLTLSLDVNFEPEKGKVNGKVTHTFKTIRTQTDSLYLDAPGINFSKIELNKKKAEYRQTPDGVWIYTKPSPKIDTEHTIYIEYSAFPKKGIYFIGWNDPTGRNRKQIWTQGQGIDNRHWIPMYDEQNDKVITEIKTTFDSKYKVISNGEKLLQKTNKDGTTTWHYKMQYPHSTYLIMLAIGDYNIKTIKSKGGVEIDLWYYPDHEERVEYTYKYSAEMMDYFENEIGVKYPWGRKYSQVPVQDFLYGAMENTTATIFGDFFFVDKRGFYDRNYVGVNAHELAHQWFGDLITARSSAHHWLQESFATHYNMIYELEVFGKDYFDWARRNAYNSAFTASKKDHKPIANSGAGSIRHYPKGAVVLEMLKYITGRENFNRAIKFYLERNAYQNVTTEDLRAAFEVTSGMSLFWFWDQWVYKGGEPHYEVSYRNITDEKGNRYTEFDVKQTHETSDLVGLFKMPIVFEVHYKDGSFDSVKEWISEKRQTVKIPNPKNKTIDYVLFDPNSEVLKSFVFHKSEEEYKTQALKAKNMIDRYDAIVGLRNVPLKEKIEVFQKIFDNPKEYHAIKSEIAIQVLNSQPKDLSAVNFILHALEKGDLNVRKAMVQAMKITSPIERELLTTFLSDENSSYDLLEATLDLLVKSDPANADNYLNKVAKIYGVRGNNVRIKFLELSIAFSKQNQDAALEELIDLSGISFEFITRKNALEALLSLNILNDRIMSNLGNACLSLNSRLAGPATAVLTQFKNRTEHQSFLMNYFNSENQNHPFSEQEFRKLRSMIF